MANQLADALVKAGVRESLPGELTDPSDIFVEDYGAFPVRHGTLALEGLASFAGISIGDQVMGIRERRTSTCSPTGETYQVLNIYALASVDILRHGLPYLKDQERNYKPEYIMFDVKKNGDEPTLLPSWALIE